MNADVDILKNTCSFYNELNTLWLEVDKDVDKFIKSSKIRLSTDHNINPLDFIYARQYLINKIYLSNGYDLDKITYLITNNMNNDPNKHDRIRDVMKIKRIIRWYKKITEGKDKKIFYKLLFLTSKFDFRYSYLQTMFYSVVYYIDYTDASNSNIDFSSLDPYDPIVFTTNGVTIPTKDYQEIDLLEEMDFLITPTSNIPGFLFLDAFLRESNINFPQGYTISPNHLLRLLNFYPYRFYTSSPSEKEPKTLDELYLKLVYIYSREQPTNANLCKVIDILIDINVIQYGQKKPPENIPPPTQPTTDIIKNTNITICQIKHVIDIALFVYYYEYINKIQMEEWFKLYVQDMIANTNKFINREYSASSLFKTMFF